MKKLIIHTLLNILAFILGYMPFILHSIISHILSFILIKIFKIRQEIVYKNLDIAFNNSLSLTQKKHIAYYSGYYFILTAIELISSQYIFPKSTIYEQNINSINKYLTNGKGVFVLCIHLGNFELIPNGLYHFLNQNVHVVVKKVGGDIAYDWLKKRRFKNKMICIERNKSVKHIWKSMNNALFNNEIVAFIADQRRNNSIKVPLFNKEAYTNDSLIKIYKHMAFPIFPIYLKRIKKREHVLVILDELNIQNNSSWTEKEYMYNNLLVMNKIIEQIIIDNPEQYFWYHDRWKINN